MIINVTNLLEKNGIDPFGLVKLSNKPFFKKLSQLQKCELINDIRFPLGVVMSTPKEVLKRIGFRPKSVSEVINQILNLDKIENEIVIVHSSLRISHIKGRKVYDYGFFQLPKNSKETLDWIEEVYSNGVIDVNTINEEDYDLGGFKPQQIDDDMKVEWLTDEPKQTDYFISKKTNNQTSH